MLVTTRSWLGKEDRELEPDLRGELPGILNWALGGLERLTITNENRFTHVEAGIEALGVMRDLAAPVAAFCRDACEVGPDRSVEVDVIYTAYRTWCDDNGHRKATKQTFGRNLRAAFPQVRIKQSREGDWRQNVRVRTYEGIEIKGAK
jgi:putative DNA primase/helicase